METYRKCKGKCNQTKEMVFFDKSGGTDKNGNKYRRWECKDCRKPYKNNLRNSLKDKKRKLFKPNSLSCCVCGYSKRTHANFTVSAIQFHHTENNKRFNVGDMWERKNKDIEKEIAKCIAVCVRCHAEITDKEW